MTGFFTGWRLAGMLLILGVAGCGGGEKSADIVPGEKGGVTATTGPDSFLLFPNPQKQDDGTLQTNILDYAQAYYQAVDPNNERTTLAAFKAKNKIGQALGTDEREVAVIFGDQRDLGYGRKMTGRMNNDGTIAFVVENYLVGGYGPYSSLNLDAAIVGESKWHLGTNGIEFSVVQSGTANPSGTLIATPTIKFLKFFTFDPVTGARLNMINLDGRGDKAMPTVCISCHGGRAEPLTPATAPAVRGWFGRMMHVGSVADRTSNALGGIRGDTGAQAHAFEPASFDFSTVAGYRRADLTERIRELNKMVLCTYVRPAGTAISAPQDNCPNASFQRRAGNSMEYDGTAVEALKNIYAGADLMAGSELATETFVPAGWAGQTALYQGTVSKACRACHELRGIYYQNDLDFQSYAKFNGYADRIKAHVQNRGNMPLAKLVYDKFWLDSSINGPMQTFLGSTNKPGRPVADLGPDRLVKATSIALSGAMSLYATGYQWTVFSSSPAGAALSNATTSTPTLTVPGSGTYEVDLVTSNASATSTSTRVKIVVDTTLAWDPAALRFADIKSILQGTTGSGFCSSCHSPGGGQPIAYTNIDRNGDGVVDATDDRWFYNEVRGRINFTDWVASPLLRKPTGNHHNGGQIYDASLTPGNASRADLDKFIAWILNGAPYN